MTPNEKMIDTELSVYNLSSQYPITYLSLVDLYTYELIILLIYGIMIIFSFFTNFVAIIIFLFGRRSRSELTPFLLNLSVFNIIMTVYCIPFTITSLIFQRWLYANQLCSVLDSFKTFSVSGVLLTLITIAIDRYCVVKYPLTVKIWSSNKRSYIAILIIWILSITIAIIRSPARSSPVPQQRLWVNSRTLLKNYLDTFDNGNVTDQLNRNYYLEQIQYKIVDTIQCVPNKIKRPVEVQRTILNFLQTYFFPLFILAFVYLRIAVLLWQRRNDTNYDINKRTANNLFSNESIQFKKKIKQGIKMLVAVVVLYAILWLPMNVFQLCYNLLCYESTEYTNFCNQTLLLQILYITAHFLTVSNTAINPIIYGFTNNRFRSDIRQLRRRLVHCQGRTPFYFRAQFIRVPQRELEDRNHHIQGNSNVTTTRKRPASLTDQNKLQRTSCTNSLTGKDQIVGRTRHTT